LPLTLGRLTDAKLLRQWQPSGSRMAWRGFYYSELWRLKVEELMGRPTRNRPIKWWDEQDADVPGLVEGTDDDVPQIDLVSLDLSARGRLDGLIETFVIGWPRVDLVRKKGFGMEPPFQRMRAPREAVVEMRTEHTRTFGFCLQSGGYVAYRFALADDTHANLCLYKVFGDEVLKLLGRMDSGEWDGTSDVNTLIGDGLPNAGP